MTEGRILIVDDEPAIRLALREVLRPRWEVTEAPDGEEALACLDADGAFDLVLTDAPARGHGLSPRSAPPRGP